MTTIENFTNGNGLVDHMTNGTSHDIVAASEGRALPLFPKANSLLFNSGNIVSTERLKRRTNSNPQDEVAEALNNTLQRWIATDEPLKAQESKSIKCRHPDLYEKIQDSEKEDISISVKLFLNTIDPEVFERAINTIMEEIGTDRIDSLVLSLPDKMFSHDDLPKEIMMPLWAAVQKSIENQKVASAGLSDFNARYLEQLCEALEDKKQKPSLNQVNLTSCCKMPDDLVEFAKINNVQLTTHVDPREILTVDSLQSCIKKNAHEYDAQGWVHLWLARYTLILKGRGIVKSKGYVVNAQRELRYTKQN